MSGNSERRAATAPHLVAHARWARAAVAIPVLRRSAITSLALVPLVGAACVSGRGTSIQDGAPAWAGSDEAVARGAGDAYDVEHYDVALTIDPRRRAIDATCRVRVWPVGGPLEHVVLDLAGLDVRSVRDADGRDLAFTRAGETLSVATAAPVRPGSFAELTVDYGGVPARGLFFTRERDGVPTQAYTHGQCIDARAWLPCHDVPYDRATWELRVTVPEAWSTICGGDRLERVAANGVATERWRLSFPCPPYLASVVAGDLAIEEDRWEGVPLVFAGAPELRAGLRTAFAETDEILAFLSERTGVRYPYSKYAQTCVDGFPFGGMENVSATTLTETAVPDEIGRADEGPTDLVAHEAAHQWFGDLVTCRDWSQAWLNEGFATYFAALYTEASRGVEAFGNERRGLRARYLELDRGANRRPIVHADAEDPISLFFSGHVYQGAALRLHYLRAILGDDAFFAGVRRFVADHARGTVATDDARRSFESASGRDLARFFDEWFLAPGHPELNSSWAYDAARASVVLTLEQVQDPSDGTPAVYQLPLAVEVVDARGTHREEVVLERRRQEFRFDVVGEPRWILVDPADDVPMALTETMPTRCWVAAATASSVSGRVRALGVLGRGAAERVDDARTRDVAVAALVAAVAQGLEDPSPWVRAAATRALGAAASAPAVASMRLHLCAALDAEREREPRLALTETLARLGPDASTAARADAWLARAEGWSQRGAFAALRVAAAPDAAHDFLVRELGVRSQHGAYEARLLAALARVKDPRAATILREWAHDEARPDAARVVAARECARAFPDATTRDALVELLASPRARVRTAAIDALAQFVQLEDATARAALEAFSARTALSRERRDVARAMGGGH